MNNESRGGVRWGTVAMAIICIIVAGSFIGLAWYFWGEDGARASLIAVGGVTIWLLHHAMYMGAARLVSNNYRDATQNIIDFQAADDRGEALRMAFQLIKSGNQLDGRILGLAGNLAKGQTRAMLEARNEPGQANESADYWTPPIFEEEEHDSTQPAGYSLFG